MTIKEWLLNQLLERGLWPEDAATVLEIALPTLASDSQIEWTDDVSTYPPVMYAAWMLNLKRIALAWIDENQPLNWCRSMFTNNQKRKLND